MTTHEHHQMVSTKIRFIIFFATEDGEALYSQQKQDLELTVAQIISSLLQKFRLKLKNVGKTARPFKYDPNQILYNYTVKVTNRFKGLELVDRILEELEMKVCNIIQEVMTKTIPKKNSRRQNDCLGGLANS